MKRLYSHAISLLCRIIPKSNTAAVHTWPAFEDTARTLVPALSRTALKKIYYLASDDMTAGDIPPDWDIQKVEVLPKRSLRALWRFLRSRYVFTTHQCYTPCFPRNVVAVNIWHGMPVKKLGWLKGQPMRATYDLATSPFWMPIIEACMRPRKAVLVNELPRNERLFSMSSSEVRQLLGGEAMTCTKVAVWLPTYRRAVRGGMNRDGHDFGNVVQMPDFDEANFEEWLRTHNMICVVKPHPLGPSPNIQTSGHLRIMDDQALAESGLTLYALLAGTDVLLTDISSVYIDYLLLNRPVIHSFADRREYAGQRGFTFDWSDDYLAGPMTDTMAGVCTALADVLAGVDTFATRREHLKQLFHQESASRASEHLLKKIGLAPQEEKTIFKTTTERYG